MFKHFQVKNFDFKLVLMIILLSAIGCLAIGSAAPSLRNRQILGVAAGVVIMLFLAFFDYKWLLKLNWLMYLANLGLLALIFTSLGDDGKGAQRWVEIGSFRFQPSETSKILLILFFAQFIMKYKEKLNTFRVIAASVVLVLIPWVLVFKQPDLSTSILLIAVFCVVMFAGGISYKVVAGVLAVAVPAFVVVIALLLQPEPNFINTHLKDYQMNRIYAFRDPEKYKDAEAYQQLNSVMAIGSGQLEGKGYKNNEVTSVKNSNFLSESQTDFIFSVIAEEFGFRGSVLVIFLIFGIALECISIARKASDLGGTIVAAGMGGLVALQGFMNIGVVTFLLPNTGLTLPFVSYGLTSLLSLYIGMGVVLNVRFQAGRPASA